MVGIIDYGVGNLFSLCSSFRAIGEEAFVSGDPAKLREADRLVLPGVGAFEDAAKKLRNTGLDGFVTEQAALGKPLLGICLGMQLLFEKSYEYGEHTGLGILKGQVVPMSGKLDSALKIPHMGWNALEVRQGKLLKQVDGQYVYFVHSFFAQNCEDSLAAVTEYGISITAAVEKGNVYGCQFHPEKSGNVGLSILRQFCRL
ncbi:MAG: imidazole glycerol phosphate synthase subunit HisH [Oscillospiraceae bacterium]|nr:imidazole glycerol phosphate synthase subunit HisH [Oscillospiraceae bacterium]